MGRWQATICTPDRFRLSRSAVLAPAHVAFLLALLLGWTALLRLPFAGMVGEDEVFFALVGQRWLAGLWPYASSFDVKPPGLFAVFALAGSLFGTSIETIKGLETVCVAVTALELWILAKRHLSRPVGLFATVLYPIYSLTLSGVNAPTELVKLPIEVLAVFATLEALRSRTNQPGFAGAAGLLIGAAAMVKQTAAFPALSLLAVLVWQLPDRRRAVVLAYGCGLACVPIMFALVFAAAGELPALIQGAVLDAAGRPGAEALSYLQALQRFMPLMKPLVVLLALAALLLTRGRRLYGTPLATGTLVIAMWLAGEAAGTAAAKAMYEHYFFALVPSLLLLAGVTACHLLGASIPSTRRAMPSLLALAAMMVASVVPVAIDYHNMLTSVDTVGAARVAHQLSALGIPSADPILVLNRTTLIYLEGGRQPASRYFHPQHLLCAFTAPDQDPLAVALQTHPSALVLAGTDRRMVCERPERHRELQSAISNAYCHAAHVSGTSDAFDIFVNKATHAEACEGQR